MKSKAVNLNDFVETSGEAGGSWNKPSFSSPAACLLIFGNTIPRFSRVQAYGEKLERPRHCRTSLAIPKISPIRLYVPILLVTGASDTGDRLLKHPIVML